ncbi:MAG TPA: hypothetical protein VFK38_05520 [Candidatus Limnocylindrales bacterium]|nr:hypothetical protein [Candidatus Limnocylindrales bacterium]
MSSNIAQNYPAGSESEAERAMAVERALERFEGLREKVAGESTPLGPDPDDDNVEERRWWVWVCPSGEFQGRLHVAGYAAERHAVYTVCDDCGKSFLR